VPGRPARAVRPTRWTYVVNTRGTSYDTTQSMSVTSMPRDIASVLISLPTQTHHRQYRNDGWGACVALHGKHNSEVRSITCHMGSHIVACLQTQLNAPCLNPSQAEWMEGWVDLVGWLNIETAYQRQVNLLDPDQRQSQTQVLTAIDTGYLYWLNTISDHTTTGIAK